MKLTTLHIKPEAIEQALDMVQKLNGVVLRSKLTAGYYRIQLVIPDANTLQIMLATVGRLAQ